VCTSTAPVQYRAVTDRDLVLALDLRDDAELIAAYVDWHRPGRVPLAVIAAIRRAGIVEMTIHHVAERLVMIMRVTADFTPERKAAIDADEPEVARWEALMDRYQQRLPGSAEKWVAMSPIFDLAEHRSPNRANGARRGCLHSRAGPRVRPPPRPARRSPVRYRPKTGE